MDVKFQENLRPRYQLLPYTKTCFEQNIIIHILTNTELEKRNMKFSPNKTENEKKRVCGCNIYIHNIKANHRKEEDIYTEHVSTGVNDVKTLKPNWMGYKTKRVHV